MILMVSPPARTTRLIRNVSAARVKSPQMKLAGSSSVPGRMFASLALQSRARVTAKGVLKVRLQLLLLPDHLQSRLFLALLQREIQQCSSFLHLHRHLPQRLQTTLFTMAIPVSLEKSVFKAIARITAVKQE